VKLRSKKKRRNREGEERYIYIEVDFKNGKPVQRKKDELVVIVRGTHNGFELITREAIYDNYEQYA
jgi:hypothetical protein